MKFKLGLIAAMIVAIAALAACGGGGAASTIVAADAPEAANAKELSFVATNYEFDQQEYRIKQGEAIKLSIDNQEGMHSLSIKGFGVELRDGDSVVAVPNKAGTYQIICSLPCGSGHSTMRATLIVE